jgi:hypothetical protein
MNNGLYIKIIRTNPSDYIRNIRIVEKKFEYLYEFFPFHPLFLRLFLFFKKNYFINFFKKSLKKIFSNKVNVFI